jgi:hypothetical protein
MLTRACKQLHLYNPRQQAEIKSHRTGQCYGSGSAWTRIILEGRIRICIRVKSRIRIRVNVKIRELCRLKMKPYSGRSQLNYFAVEVLCRPVVADSDHLDENLDPHQKERRGSGSATKLCGSGSVKPPARHLDFKTDHRASRSA